MIVNTTYHIIRDTNNSWDEIGRYETLDDAQHALMRYRLTDSLYGCDETYRIVTQAS